jgi:hypothetical protein
MIEQIRSELLYILKTVPEVIKNPAKLSELSDYSVKIASIYQDPDSITLAIVIYSMSKLISRYEAHELENWEKVYSDIMQEMKNAQADLESDNVPEFKQNLRQVVKLISGCDKDLKMYIQEVIEKAKIKKGSKMHEQGVSIQRVANLMGVSMWEIMSYVGKTGIMDQDPASENVEKRLMFAKNLFGAK